LRKRPSPEGRGKAKNVGKNQRGCARLHVGKNGVRWGNLGIIGEGQLRNGSSQQGKKGNLWPPGRKIRGRTQEKAATMPTKTGTGFAREVKRKDN